MLASNDNWQDATNADDIGSLAASIRPLDYREPAILLTLEPGLYTAHLLGVNGDTGNGNVAVYDLSER